MNNVLGLLVISPIFFILYPLLCKLLISLDEFFFDVVISKAPDEIKPSGSKFILLQIFDDGHLTDSKGRKVDFRNTLIVMTSNIGSDLIREDRSIGFNARTETAQGEQEAYERMKNNVLEEVKHFFRPEFLNRVDGTVVFHALSREHMEYIVDIMMQEVAVNLLEKGISMEVTDVARSWLAEEGYDPTFGARPLRRVIQDTVEDKLSDAILGGELGPADTAVIDIEEDVIIVRTETPASLTSSTL